MFPASTTIKVLPKYIAKETGYSYSPSDVSYSLRMTARVTTALVLSALRIARLLEARRRSSMPTSRSCDLLIMVSGLPP